MEQTPRRTIHYTELPAAKPGSRMATEWETYRREVDRLLAEGHEGKFILIKGEEIVGIYETEQQATAEGYRRYDLEPLCIKQILRNEPLLRPPNVFYRGSIDHPEKRPSCRG